MSRVLFVTPMDFTERECYHWFTTDESDNGKRFAMTSVTPAQGLQGILNSTGDGEPVELLQIKLYRKFGLRLSCQAIENTLLNYPDLFAQKEGNWKLKRV
jgi:hypothetical protein